MHDEYKSFLFLFSVSTFYFTFFFCLCFGSFLIIITLCAKFQLYWGMRKPNWHSSSNQSRLTTQIRTCLRLHSRAASSVGVTSPFQRSQHRKQFWRRADHKKTKNILLKLYSVLCPFSFCFISPSHSFLDCTWQSLETSFRFVSPSINLCFLTYISLR